MEVAVSKKELLKVVGRMQGIADKRSSMAVLANVLLSADDRGTLSLSATDLYLSLVGKVDAENVKPGNVAVSAKDLFDRLKVMPDGPLVISANERAATLKAKGAARRYTLRAMSGEDFPPIPRPTEDSPTLALEAGVLRSLIQRTQFSVATDETRPHLNAGLFEWDDDVVRIVSTDGHRLTKAEVTLKDRHAAANMLIPLKALKELLRMCDEILAERPTEGAASSQDVLITPCGSSAFFQGAGMTFSVKLVDAQFPPYAQVIPKKTDRELRVQRAAFADALRAVSVAASERTGGVKLALVPGSMRITSESPDSGDGFDEVPVEYSGPNMTYGINARYYLDAMGAAESDEISIGLNGELDPSVLRPAANGANEDFLAVVMPLRI